MLVDVNLLNRGNVCYVNLEGIKRHNMSLIVTSNACSNKETKRSNQEIDHEQEKDQE